MHSDLIKEALEKASKLTILKNKKISLSLWGAGLRYFAEVADDKRSGQITESSVIGLNEALYDLIHKIESLYRREVK